MRRLIMGILMLIVLVPPALGSNQAGAAASAEWEGAALQSEWEQHLSELQGADPADALQRLLAEGTRYGHLADYQYWVAIYMLASDQPLEAVSLQLERALMMDPNHAGALYDYGAIQCRIGQEASCQTILKEARRRFGIPPVIKQSYNLAPVIRGELRLGLGHTNNYNQAGSADTIPLQFGTETLVVQLGNEQRPTATPYHWQSVDVSLRHPQHPQFEIRAGLLTRTPLAKQDILGRRNSMVAELQWHASVTHHYAIHYQSIRDRKLGGIDIQGLRWRYTPESTAPESQQNWALSVGVERRRPHGPEIPYNTVMAQLLYAHKAFLGGRLQLALGYEQDLSQTYRPGQAQQRSILAAALNYPNLLPARGNLRLMLRHTEIRDQAAYSPLFGDTHRNSAQAEGGIALNWPVATRTDLQLELRHFQERSNLLIFEQRETQLNLSLGYTF